MVVVVVVLLLLLWWWWCCRVVVVVLGGTIQTRHTEIDDVPGPTTPGVAEEPLPELGDLGRELPGHGRHGA